MELFPGFKVVSFFPGRLKLRVDKVKDDQSFAAKVEKELRELVSIKLIEANAESGKVLMHLL